jgi:hypothetical protein
LISMWESGVIPGVEKPGKHGDLRFFNSQHLHRPPASPHSYHLGHPSQSLAPKVFVSCKLTQNLAVILWIDLHLQISEWWSCDHNPLNGS